MAVQEQEVIDQVKASTTDEHSPVADAGEKIVLAAIGAVALTGDALEKALDRMVKRGETTQKNAQKKMRELRAKGPQLRGRGSDKLHTAVPDTLDVPSKADVQALHDQIADLSAKIDQLKSATPEKAATPSLKVQVDTK